MDNRISAQGFQHLMQYQNGSSNSKKTKKAPWQYANTT